MMNREEREAGSAFWMQDLRECSSAGERLSNYARHHGLNVGEGYQWTGVLRREGLWPLVKRGVVGTFHKVSHKYLQLYVNEFEFRYNNRKNAHIFGAAIRAC